jgi:hypothetical protein
MMTRKLKRFRQVRAAMSVIPYIQCGAGGSIQLSLSLGSFGSNPFTHCLSILFIAFPLGSEKRLTALSVKAAPNAGRRPASGARPPGRVLHCGLGLSSPWVLLKGPRDALRSLPGSMHCPRSFLCVARDHRRSFPCLSDMTEGTSGGATPPPFARRHDVIRAGRLPLFRSSCPLRARFPRNHVALRGRRAAHRPRPAVVGWAH